MTKGVRFSKSVVRLLLETQGEELLMCDGCKSEATNGELMWVFQPQGGISSETCCLACAALVKEDPEPYEVDQ